MQIYANSPYSLANATTSLMRYVLEHEQIGAHRPIVVDLVGTLVTRVLPLIRQAVRAKFANREVFGNS